MIRTARYAMLLIPILLWQCSPPPEPTYTELTIQYINQLRPQLLGTWQFKQTQIEAKKLRSNRYSKNYTGIVKDTVLQNMATLNLEPFSGKVYDERVLNLDGSIRFRGKLYPVEVRIYPIRNEMQKGIMWVAFKHVPNQVIDYDSDDAKYIDTIGLVGVNFNLNTELGQPSMTLKTNDTAITQANLVKE